MNGRNIRESASNRCINLCSSFVFVVVALCVVSDFRARRAERSVRSVASVCQHCVPQSVPLSGSPAYLVRLPAASPVQVTASERAPTASLSEAKLKREARTNRMQRRRTRWMDLQLRNAMRLIHELAGRWMEREDRARGSGAIATTRRGGMVTMAIGESPHCVSRACIHSYDGPCRST